MIFTFLESLCQLPVLLPSSTFIHDFIHEVNLHASCWTACSIMWSWSTYPHSQSPDSQSRSSILSVMLLSCFYLLVCLVWTQLTLRCLLIWILHMETLPKSSLCRRLYRLYSFIFYKCSAVWIKTLFTAGIISISFKIFI